MLFGDRFKKTQIKTNGATINLVHGGEGYPLLLLHGYPQAHVIWHKIAPLLVDNFHIICPDLRGYGDSSKPTTSTDHYPYSKRAMAQDMDEVMEALGYQEYYVAGHDRGGRVAHRMARDYPNKVAKICVMDIAPTWHMFNNTDKNFATGYYHWFFLIQGNGLPEHMIGLDPEYYLKEKLKRWAAPNAVFSEVAVAEYVRCFSRPEAIHASCEDYRAAASIDLKHDEEDMNSKIKSPMLVLWGEKGFVNKTYDVLNVWEKYAEKVMGKRLDCGHFLPEELPTELVYELQNFFVSKSYC